MTCSSTHMILRSTFTHPELGLQIATSPGSAWVGFVVSGASTLQPVLTSRVDEVRGRTWERIRLLAKFQS